MMKLQKFFALILLFGLCGTAMAANERARDLGVPFDGTPGPLNAITDVKGVEVGHTTLISETPEKKAVRTGVTAILPRGKSDLSSVFSAWFSLNGNGEMTGTTWIEESGLLEGPVMITNTHSVGVVRDAVIEWLLKQTAMQQAWGLPVVAETWDGWLNDLNGFHVTKEHTFQALSSAKAGPVQEGNVGGGTGMVCYEFKGGIGTSSRKLADNKGGYMVGILVQANFGLRPQLTIAGVPVGKEIREGAIRSYQDTGSIIIVLATDAPLLPHQLKRLARRTSLGLARTGSVATNGSGDIFIAFSTANANAGNFERVESLQMLPNTKMDALFEATVQATEEAIVNALVAAETMTGIDNHTVVELPHDRLQEVLKKYNRLAD